eukprot:Protomagalhaensia_sp_Gyna_25__68@NODE_1034_length_2264_cov_63_275056_g824_i0_p1_GENE_NODE_1034_length_2264_cov_63_275056_g824_i0NODE_1034_length_2264_cov_63_275056_g824_i0_p1_ORF_typecomplete_len519_score107_32GMP_synt_C/PF00958_22/2_7e37GATase/PF00117_28/4e37GATase/PF00117_28/6_7e03NAD_synthase/PF02540_17/1_4e21ThiI/PF02568_14/1_7e21ATP_bind_3/PF01171_20/4_7e10Asn_synthase/PF00733_21/1_1e08Asn_synthase/PF00733_21/5e03Peptidase_C26/PF07722_13/3_4e08QueC/PF06508_13/6_3e08tRNA_Me_trans/PF03054_16/
MTTERIVIIDCGSQFTQLIARRIREIGVYCEIVPWTASYERLKALSPKGVILSGSHMSTLDEESPKVPTELFGNVPVLGICYGMQAMADQLGGRVELCCAREFGFADVKASLDCPLFQRCKPDTEEGKFHVWMSHGDQVVDLPAGFSAIASTENCAHAAMADPVRNLYALQFHPEVTETYQGRAMLEAFVIDICECRCEWQGPAIVEELLATAKEQCSHKAGDVLLALSGGVDSAVVAAILHRAIGPRLKCVLVDNGLLRLNEAKLVREAFRQHHPELHLTVVDASEEFLRELKGVSDPEVKRKIIGSTFISVFERTAAQFDNVQMLAQGTIYPDVIESAAVGTGAVIKTHHNVGGLPERMKLSLVEPLRRLFKDEVRRVGEALGLPKEFVWRHPFPGPGLGVRILGEVDQEKADKLRVADAIWLEELHSANLYDQAAQAFAVLLPCKSVAVKGDGRCYEDVIALRAVATTDFMTARCVVFPWQVLQTTARRICNELPGISRVVYDLTDKPPATIEWE